jgi:hypothetical protein
MRALAALRMVWASAVWMAVEMLATWCVRKLNVNVNVRLCDFQHTGKTHGSHNLHQNRTDSPSLTETQTHALATGRTVSRVCPGSPRCLFTGNGNCNFRPFKLIIERTVPVILSFYR